MTAAPNSGSDEQIFGAKQQVSVKGQSDYTLLPFGYKAVPRDEYFGREDVGTGPLGVIGNIVWLLRWHWATWSRRSCSP